MTIFGRKTASIIGMIHLQPLPGKMFDFAFLL